MERDPIKMEKIDYSETLAFKIKTPVNHPEDSIKHLEYGESLKSRIIYIAFVRQIWSSERDTAYVIRTSPLLSYYPIIVFKILKYVIKIKFNDRSQYRGS
jgi:hypothetical protein